MRLCCITAGAFFFLAGCSRSPVVRELPPYETLVTVTADFYRFAQVDLYRHEMPRDASGQNVFRATLERLKYYEVANLDTDRDIVACVRGEAYERLGEYDRAIEAFKQVTAAGASPLEPKAARRVAALRRLRQAVMPTTDATNLSGYIESLEKRVEDLTALEKVVAKEPLDTVLVKREREQAETEYALALFRNRYVVDQGAGRAIDFAVAMIERHAESCRIQAHRLMLGEFYFELARDMTRFTSPDGLTFDSALFLDLVNAARKQYAAVSQADGYREKAEGAAMLDALEAFARKVRRQLE